MKFSFEANLQYQLEAVKAVTDLFKGQPTEESLLECMLEDEGALDMIRGVGNRLFLTEEQIKANLKKVQERNGLAGNRQFEGRIKNKRQRKKVTYRKGFEADPKFLEIWEKIRSKTRSTVFHIIKNSGRLGDLLVNPQLFLDYASAAIKRTLQDLMVDGIKYEKISGSKYEMRLFEEQELDVYMNDLLHHVQAPSKTIYEEIIPLDSEVESSFARDCESSEQVKFFFKLPGWFRIPTPVGSYNPDWAVVFKDGQKIYFVAETKDTGDRDVDVTKLRKEEQLKIKCGKAHFREFEKVEYKVVNRVGQLLNSSS